MSTIFTKSSVTFPLKKMDCPFTSKILLFLLIYWFLQYRFCEATLIIAPSIFIIIRMLSSNPELLNDLNTLLQGIKKRQELHIVLLQYIKKVIANKDDSSMFIEQQVHSHRMFVAEITTKDVKIRNEQQLLKQKYPATRQPTSQLDLKLVSRLTLRILQICQASFQKLKQYFNYYQQPHHDFHQTVTKMLQNEQCPLNLSQLFEKFLKYSREKYDGDMSSLNAMIEMIAKGEKDMVDSVTQERVNRREREIEDRKREAQDRRRREVAMVEAEILHKKEKEKLTDRMSKLKEQAKEMEKIKKRKSRFVEKVFTKMYSVLDPVKQQIMDDMIYTCKPDQQFKKLYTEIFERNHQIYNQISHFYNKADDFQEKIRLFKERMLLQPPRKSRGGIRAMSNQSNEINMQAYCSTECLTQNQKHNRESVLSTDRPMQPQPMQNTDGNQQVKLLSVQSPQKHQRRSAAEFLQSRMSIQQRYPPSCDRLPKINPFFDRKQRKERYQSHANKTRRFSDPKSGQAVNASLKLQSRIMQVPLIHLNMVEKFEFKVNHNHNSNPQPKKEKLPKAFEYTFHFRKRENRFMETRQNFML